MHIENKEDQTKSDILKKVKECMPNRNIPLKNQTWSEYSDGYNTALIDWLNNINNI